MVHLVLSLAEEQESAQQISQQRVRGCRGDLEPAEHAAVVVSVVTRVQSLHHLAHADLEVFELPQQLYRHDQLSKRILLPSQLPEIISGRFYLYVEWV